MRIGNREFRPSAGLTLITVIAVAVLVKLGFWQLDRAEQKRALLTSFIDGTTQTPQWGPLADDVAREARYMQLAVTGRYDGSRQFLLDNMVHQGRAGFHVLTPFALKDQQGWLLVNRGWIPVAGNRESLPAVEVDDNRRTISGRIDFLPRPGLRLDGATAEAGWPRVVVFPEMGTLSAALGQQLYEYVLLLAPEAEDGFLREWRPAISGPGRNLAYAVQWFALALTVSIIYVALNVREVPGNDDKQD